MRGCYFLLFILSYQCASFTSCFQSTSPSTHREVGIIHGPDMAVCTLLVGDLKQVAGQLPVQGVERGRLELHVDGRRIVLKARDARFSRLARS